MAKPLLLLVDDDQLIRDTLAIVLSRDFEVVVAASRPQAVEVLRNSNPPPDLALVDLGLPPVPHEPTEGFALIGALLAHNPRMKVIVLSGQDEDGAGRQARALGATDFVGKPANPSRLRALLLAAFAALQVELNNEPRPATVSMRLRSQWAGKNAEKSAGRAQVEKPLTESQPAPIIQSVAPAASTKSGAADAFNALLGSSAAMQALRSQLSMFADSPFPVLLEGESGSGKELAAAALQARSVRANKPFLALNCAAISPTLVEPTLFGYAKGAFTGAQSAKAGYFEDAEDGTLLLDEIGELPLELQAKLLRVLENGEYNRVGETQARRSQARIVAATNRDLRQEVKQGRFRADLYHRLSVFTVRVPPLRELERDKLTLFSHFAALYAKSTGLAACTLEPAAAESWLAYPFPGNVRELRNIVIRLTAKFPGAPITQAGLAQELDWLNAHTAAATSYAPAVPAAAASPTNPAMPSRPLPSLAFDEPAALAQLAAQHLSQPVGSFKLETILAAWERAYIDSAMDLARGNVSHAARLLGVNRTTLYSRMTILQKVDAPTKSGTEPDSA